MSVIKRKLAQDAQRTFVIEDKRLSKITIEIDDAGNARAQMVENWHGTLDGSPCDMEGRDIATVANLNFDLTDLYNAIIAQED